MNEPVVVLIDDEPDKVDGLAEELRRAKVEVVVVEPHHLDAAMMREGTIFLVDMFLEEWPGRKAHEAAAQVFDGIALAGVIRSRARVENRAVPIVALNTGHPRDLSDLPPEIREHAIARAHNLEWVFLKNDSAASAPTFERVIQLVEAQRQLPRAWTTTAGEADLLDVLGAHQTELREILDAWPPIREVGADSAGIAVLRWLMHRILPYPTFLLDQRHVAARLGLRCSSIGRLRDEGGDLAEALEKCRYTGILAEFDGPRWWRSRLESMLWDYSPKGSLPATVDDLLAIEPGAIEAASTPNGVVVLAADYTPRDEPVDVSSAVRIALDDWPPYAEQAWAAIEEAQADPGLRERVLPIDRKRLSSSNEV